MRRGLRARLLALAVDVSTRLGLRLLAISYQSWCEVRGVAGSAHEWPGGMHRVRHDKVHLLRRSRVRKDSAISRLISTSAPSTRTTQRHNEPSLRQASRSPLMFAVACVYINDGRGKHAR